MSNGQVEVGNFPFGSGGGGGATSVSNSDGTLTISPTTGAVVASLNLAEANTWTANQVFNNSLTGGNQVGNAQPLPNLTGFLLGKQTFSGSFDVDLLMYSFGGNANITWTCNALSGIYAGPTTGAATLILGSTQTAALGFTDTAVGDTIVNATTGKTVRVGVGAGASTVQVIASGITVTGTTVNNGDVKVNSSNALFVATVRDTAGASVMTTATGIATFPNPTNFTTGIKNNSAQTTVSGSVAGSIICSMPEQGSTYKIVVIFMSAMNGTAVYTFPTAFVHAPSSVGVFSGVTATPTNTNVTITNTSALSGSLLFFGF